MTEVPDRREIPLVHAEILCAQLRIYYTGSWDEKSTPEYQVTVVGDNSRAVVKGLRREGFTREDWTAISAKLKELGFDTGEFDRSKNGDLIRVGPYRTRA